MNCYLKYHRGLILVKPHGSYVKKGQKTVIIKSKLITTIIHQNLLLIEGKHGLGIIQLEFPIKIDLPEFNRMNTQHLITENERLQWWPKYQELYAYPIIKKKIFKKPLLLIYPSGPQITVKPDNITIRKVYVGISGFLYPQMYPNNLKKSNQILDYYAEHFNSVEINSTFYRYPGKALVQNLMKHDLIYSIKVNQVITHYKKLKNVAKEWIHFSSFFENMKEKVHCFLFQFSSQFHCNNKNILRLTKLKSILNKTYRYAFEFRDIAWYSNENVIEIFKANQWIMVIVNVFNLNHWAGNLENGFNPPLSKYIPTSDTIYIRMHGSIGQYVGSYKNQIINEIRKYISFSNNKYSMIYFNNTDINNDAFHDALLLINTFNICNLSY